MRCAMTRPMDGISHKSQKNGSCLNWSVSSSWEVPVERNSLNILINFGPYPTKSALVDVCPMYVSMSSGHV